MGEIGPLYEKIVAAVAARAEKFGKRRNNRMTGFFIGQDRVGKTSLKKSLLGKTFSDQQSSTVGIDIDVVEVDERNKSRPWRLAQDQELLASEARISRAVVEEAAKMLIDDDDGRGTNNGGDGDGVVAVDGAALSDGVAADAKGDANVIVVDHSGSGNGGRRGDDGHDGGIYGNIRGVSVHGGGDDVNGSISTDGGEDNEIHDSGIYDDGFSGGNESVRNDLPQQDWSKKTNPALEDEAFRESVNTARVPLTDELIKIIVKEVATVKEYSDDVDKIRMILADVSGQSVFYDIHSLFLTPHSICLLVVDLTKPLLDKAEPLFVNFERGIKIPLENYLVETNLDYGNRWMTVLNDLEKIHEGTKRKGVSRAGKNQFSRLPPTILVLTKPDKLLGTSDEIVKQIGETKSMILESFTSNGYRPRILKTCVIDNTKSQSFPQGGQLEELRGLMFDTAQGILRSQDTISIPTLQFERALGTLMNFTPCITAEEAKHLGKELEISDEQVVEILKHLHQQNIIVHFHDDESENSLIVLDTRWLVKVFTKVITVPPLDEQMGEQAILWQDLTKRGVLSSKLLDVAMEDHGKEKKALLKFMERAHLMCYWKDKVYLVPSMVKPKKKEQIKQFLFDNYLVPSLFVNFPAKYVPMGFYTRLQSEFIRWSKGSDEMPQLSCNISRFFLVEDHVPFSVVLVQHISRIQVSLISEGARSTQEKVVEIAWKVKYFLLNAIKSIEKAHALYRNMEYDLAVKCGLCCDEKVNCGRHNEEACEDVDCVHLWRLDELKDDPVACPHVLFSKRSVFDISKVQCWMDRTDIHLKSNQLQWIPRSVEHRKKFEELLEYEKAYPEKIQTVNGVRFCCNKKFLIDTGCDGTRVYIGLGNDGIERAVKRLFKDVCGSLGSQEKEILNILDSMHVVRYWFYDENSNDEYTYLILDLCEETLTQYVSKQSLDNLRTEASVIIRQILEGLTVLHGRPKPVLHRDLKPSNILRNVNGRWLLADFGISRTLREGQTTHKSEQKGTKYWRAVESYPVKDESGVPGPVRYKTKSDIQVAGMVSFYILTKGEHPFGPEEDRLKNLRDGNPVDLAILGEPVAEDMISWMLKFKPEERPSAEEALKHIYFQSTAEQFELLSRMGNQPEVKQSDTSNNLITKLNNDPILVLKDWKSQIHPTVLDYLCTVEINRKRHRSRIKKYGSEWSGCLRLIRNTAQHWNDRPRPRPEAHTLVGEPHVYFLKLFPRLPVVVHRIVRSDCEWKERPELKKFFA